LSTGEKVPSIISTTGHAKSWDSESNLRHSLQKKARYTKSPLAIALRCESAKGIILIRNFIVLSAAFCALTLQFAVFALPVAAADLLLFPSITSVHQSKADAELAAKKFVPAVDIFYATEFSQTRFLSGYLASSRRQDGLEFNSISAQWSMVLPL
jgi:hypothetical protein